MKLLHTASMVVGAVAVSALVASFAFRSPAVSPQSMATAYPISVAISGPVEVHGIAKPKSMIVITDSTPYTVPAGKLFVLTALGSTGWWSPTTFVVDGGAVVSTVQATAGAYVPGTSGAYTTIQAVPPGFTAGPTSVLTVNGVNGRAWGYLVDL